MFFETFETDRNLIGSALAGSGGHAWTQVKLGHFVPFFIMEVGPSDCYSAETWLVGSISCLLANHAMLKKEFPERAVSTLLVIPNQIRQGKKRLIAPVAEVWERQQKQSDPLFRFILSDGQVVEHGTEIGNDTSDTAAWERLF